MGVKKILLIDEDAPFRKLLAERLQDRQFEVTAVENGNKALSLCKEHPFDFIISEMKLTGMTGLQLLEKIRDQAPETRLIFVTAFGTIENAVESMQLGAFDYLLKPLSIDKLEALITKTNQPFGNQGVKRGQIVNRHTHSEVKIISESPSMKRILANLENIANSHASVCIYGESGTGKEVIAQLIHESSPRSAKPFVKVNCAAIPETLIESEFFGHEKGAFTGASSRRLGRFELANMGSLLLDEITETPINFQAKLLRVVQEQEFHRVGGNQAISVNVRLISTSNRNIKEAISQKLIREDLYYRLNVIPIFLPPLRERREEILPLAEYFLHRSSAQNQRKLKTLSAAAQQKLLNYDWPGNVRELANLIERAVIIDPSEEIGPDILSYQEEDYC